jgi:hypothetical protein
MGWRDDPVAPGGGAKGWASDPRVAAPDDDKTGLLSAGVQGFGQGASLGFSDELNGVVGGGLDKVLPESLGGAQAGKSFLDLYRENRDFARKLNAKAAGDQPAAYLGGNLAGGLATTIATSGLIKPAIGSAGIMGAVQGLGSSDADLTKGDVVGAARDTAIGGALGIGAGLLGNEAGKIVGGAADRLKGFANKQALASLRGTAGDYAKILGRGQVDNLGDFLLNEQVPGLGAAVEGGSLPENIADKLEAMKASGGAKLNQVLPELDIAAQSSGISAIDHQGISREIVGLIQDAQRAGPKAGPIVDALSNDLGEFIKQVPGTASFTDAEAIKRGYWAAAQKALNKLPRDRTAADDVSIMLGGIVKDSIEKQAEAAANAVAQPQLLKDFLDAKKLYGSSEGLLGIAGRAEGRAFARNLASPSDKLTAATEFANSKAAGSGDVVSGVKGMLASAINNQVRRRAASTLAAGANAVSTKIQRLATTSPGTLGAYGSILSGALERGGQQAFNAHVFTLGQTDPKFQALQQKLAQENDHE